MSADTRGEQPVGDGLALGPTTKGLRLTAPATVDQVLAGRPAVDDARFSWPLLTLDDEALTHNIRTMAALCRRHGAEHAPHVKTALSRELFARQHAVGAWGATVANAGQLRTVRSWGVERVLVANEILDPRDWSALAADIVSARGSGSAVEVLTYVDGPEVVAAARAALDRWPAAAAGLGLVVELGVPGGRTGVRDVAAGTTLARAATRAGLPVLGVAGYEGSAAAGAGTGDRAAVAEFCGRLLTLADALSDEGLLHERTGGVPVLSAGGSAYVDVVLPHLTAGPRARQVIMRSGAYVTHDHGLCARSDPWSRFPEPTAMQPAATVWAQVLATPEPGLAIVGAGRRDVPYDIDLPVLTAVRRRTGTGWSAPQPFTGPVVDRLDDQHLYLRPGAEDGTVDVATGDVVGLGISHPCTLFDKWRVAAVTDVHDRVIGLVSTDF
ncbi:alanine racemase [Georgenia satyanarayanai]|uniref:alanine racemase n=1 Tax=Georgenia satyanarayanai TaxID=860221 RepID=UPI00203EF6A9|nr:alanine racemase [Georgenia satyanarayanai]MCM3660264.1 alanine racemase [Georgenia satyanarayanai]